METIKSFEEGLYQVNDGNFENIAIKLFRFQIENNPVYREFATQLGRDQAQTLADIPFLPISFFKTRTIQTGNWIPETVFSSSGTGGPASHHAVKDLTAYLRHSAEIFRSFFGPLQNYHILALLPSYLERDGSSLVAMANHFIQESGSPYSGFYLNDPDKLVAMLGLLRKSEKKTVLLGVTFALLELAESHPMDLSHCLIMETGGMKGRRKELTREELHAFLGTKLNVNAVLSEYGMTELLSQAYSFGGGRFHCPPGLKVLIREVNDPFVLEKPGKTGAINMIDLANMYSCAFIETQDLGKTNEDGSFEVLGRMDNSDIRGCNLMVG